MKQSVTRKIVMQSTACPACMAAPGQQCMDVGKYEKSLHTDRWARFHLLRMEKVSSILTV